MVPGKETEDHFGEVDVGDTDTIQVTVDIVIYNLWELKEFNYVMRVMDTGGHILVDGIFKETVRRWE